MQETTKRSINVRAAHLVALLFVATSVARALDPARQISQYGHTAWRAEEGYFTGAPHVAMQTADGYLWIGTETGLVRFDGVRFVNWTPPAGNALPGISITALLGARDGSLWIGTTGGLAHWEKEKLVNYLDSRGRINAIVEDRDGAVWIVRSRITDRMGPLCRVSGTVLHCYEEAAGTAFTSDGAAGLADDRSGGLWMSTTRALRHWKPDSSETYLPKSVGQAEGTPGIQAFALGPDGSLVIGMGERGPGLGLQRFVSGNWMPYDVPGLRGSALDVAAMLLDRNKGLWVATQKSGIYHFHGASVDHFGQAQGLSSDSVDSFYEDREGNIWVATPQGIDRFRDIRVTTLSKPQGLSGDHVASIVASRSGVVWMGNGGALEALDNNKLSVFRTGGALPGQRVTALLEDHAGRLLLGVDSGLVVLEEGRFRNVRKDHYSFGMVFGLAEDTGHDVWALTVGRPQKLIRIRDLRIVEELSLSDAAVSLAPDPDGGVWLAYRNGTLARYRAGRFDILSPGDGSALVRHIFVDSEGSTWAAGAGGVIRWKGGRRQTLGLRNGLPCDTVFSAIKDDKGSLWLYASCGIISINNSELDKWWAEPRSSVTAGLLDSFDGSRPGASPFSPVVAKSPDGRIWFTNDKFVQIVDPNHLAYNQLPPPVHIEHVTADRKDYVLQDNLRLPPATRNLEIDYTALSFVAPQKVRFRYKLEGRDDAWQEAGTRRQALYTDLSPREYRFKVVASNNDGLWNMEGATWNFVVEPAYYQTIWFQLLCLGTGAFGLWTIYRLRMRRHSALMTARFDERMAERNRLSGELHDTLLQSVQASKMLVNATLESRSADAAHMRRTLERLAIWLTQAAMESRAALSSLRRSTTQRNDLAEALQQAADTSDVDRSMRFTFVAEGATREMHPIVRDEVFRIGAEAIRNAFLHSEGTDLRVTLHYARDLTVRVRDNGRGIPEDFARNGKPGHFGLSGMQERAIRVGGRLRVVSNPDAGTDVELVVPGPVVFCAVQPAWRRFFNRTRHPFQLRKDDTKPN